MKILRAVLIDDHPLIVDAYRQGIAKIAENRGIPFDIVEINSLKEAERFFREESEILKSTDLVFLDISLPIDENKKFLSGEDIGIRLRKDFPETRIIISTSFSDNFRIYNILRSVDPDGFLLKRNLTPYELLTAIDNILNNPPYYSKSILQLFRKQINSDQILDDLDRRLLYELSIGTKMKDIPGLLPLSMAGVERRKRNLRLIFDIHTDGDAALIKVAREKGFI